ncbi:MAG TPA: chemotaxis protein CheW [Tepidiformaceae bacterium]
MTQPLQKVLASTDVASADHQVVVFRLSSGHYAIDIQHVQEIVRMQEISTIPESDPCIEGVTNLRGRVVPVMDLRRRCAVPETPPTADTRIVVVGSEQGVVGLMVDSVSEVLRIPSGQVDAPSDIVRGERNGYVTGVAKLKDRLICLLDLSRLVTTQLPDTSLAAVEVKEAA